MNILVTGGAGFIGGAVIRHIINNTSHNVLNMDILTYAGNLESLIDVSSNSRYSFEKVDICDPLEVHRVFKIFKPDIVMHLAAESHVDNSIKEPEIFIKTNVLGTYNLLNTSRIFFEEIINKKNSKFLFHHISTDEVYGDLESESSFFVEDTPYSPSSPYSASKASSDHLVRAWSRTFSLPTVITNCSNNYGPYHFPEKLIPKTIINAIQGLSLPIYGNGLQVRDWLFVEDHAEALITVALKSNPGETFNIGGNNEKTNIEVVKMICELLNEFIVDKPNGIGDFKDLIEFVSDRPGHDKRYAIDASKIKKELNWQPKESFETGLRKTVK